MPVDETHLKDAAAHSEFTLEDLSETSGKLEQAIQGRLNEHFKRCRLRRGPNYWLLEEFGTVWLAFDSFELGDELREAGFEFDSQQLLAVADAHLNEFQDGGLTVEVPGTVARSRDDGLFYPINVQFPDDWEAAQWHVVQRFQELTSRYEMTPAEALDYWVIERMNKKSTEWAGVRDVRPEAVRKNVRQAKEKLEDEDLGATHENGNIRPVSLDEIPEDDPHDPDKDVFYVPTTE